MLASSVWSSRSCLTQGTRNTAHSTAGSRWQQTSENLLGPNFSELRKGEVRRMLLPRTPVNRELGEVVCSSWGVIRGRDSGSPSMGTHKGSAGYARQGGHSMDRSRSARMEEAAQDAQGSQAEWLGAKQSLAEN